MKSPYQTETPVLLIFFVRDDVLAKTFSAVRAAKPKTLFLWQDGPRADRADDIEGIDRCRKIVENIDWECTVYKQYNTENIGCDPSIYMAYKWAFTYVERCIFLEDDQVPCLSYFRFCDELLEKYKDDTRISHICGYNYLGSYESCPDDYLFARSGSGAWATWKRVADEWDETYQYTKDLYMWKSIIARHGKLSKFSYLNSIRRSKTGKAYWESIVGANCLINNHLVIIPKCNLVSNHGITLNATHSVASTKLLPRATRKLFFSKTYEISFPLKHPIHIFPHSLYEKAVYRLMGLGHPILHLFRRIESKVLRIINAINFK